MDTPTQNFYSVETEMLRRKFPLREAKFEIALSCSLCCLVHRGKAYRAGTLCIILQYRYWYNQHPPTETGQQTQIWSGEETMTRKNFLSSQVIENI